MIDIKPKFDSSNEIIFEYSTQDEKHFLEENAEKILDEFVKRHFKNIGNLSIKTWKDYLDFVRLSPQKVIEMYDGHPCTDFGDLENRNALIIRDEATKSMAYSSYTLKLLAELSNDMYKEFIQ